MVAANLIDLRQNSARALLPQDALHSFGCTDCRFANHLRQYARKPGAAVSVQRFRYAIHRIQPLDAVRAGPDEIGPSRTAGPLLEAEIPVVRNGLDVRIVIGELHGAAHFEIHAREKAILLPAEVLRIGRAAKREADGGE